MRLGTFDALSEFADLAHHYRYLRGRFPLAPAGKVVDFLKGDDESHHGEGRVTCTRCGADGDA